MTVGDQSDDWMQKVVSGCDRYESVSEYDSLSNHVYHWDDVSELDAYLPLYKRDGEIVLERYVPTIHHPLLTFLVKFPGEEVSVPNG
jgi:hypothetical protein